MSKSKEMRETTITMKYDKDFEIRVLKVRAGLINYLENNLKIPLDKNIDHNKLVSLTRSYILDTVKKDFSKTELIKPQDFTIFCVKIMDFCLDYGFIILDTISKLEQFQNFEVLATKIKDKINNRITKNIIDA